MWFVPGSCHLLIVTAHARQGYDDGEPVPDAKEAKLYDRVGQTLDLVGYLVRTVGRLLRRPSSAHPTARPGFL